jgi:hypothetical protein
VKLTKLFMSLTGAGLVTLGCTALFGGNPASQDLPVINLLNAAIQHRFEDPEPARLGMSRTALPQSFGTHYRPSLISQTDFRPENEVEASVVGELEHRHDQVGFYLFGLAIADSDPAGLNFRALKGPAAVTEGTPRPAWYPPQPKSAEAKPGALPDWEAIYTLARRAMKSFQDGGQGFETTFDGWNIAARPVMASQARCVGCHNVQPGGRAHPAVLDRPIGGVLYAFRRAS